MAKSFTADMFGMPIIMRHDYEDEVIQEKLKVYQKASYDAFREFLTNVPNFKYGTFLDVGCGDEYVMDLARQQFEYVHGIDLYVDNNQYPNVDIADWYKMSEPFAVYSRLKINAMFINHSLEHAANVYALMEQVSKLQNKGDALFIAVPDGDTPFGYSITSSTTHFSCITEGYLATTLQRFGYNVAVERREFRPDSKEIWAFAIKQFDGWGN